MRTIGEHSHQKQHVSYSTLLNFICLIQVLGYAAWRRQETHKQMSANLQFCPRRAAYLRAWTKLPNQSAVSIKAPWASNAKGQASWFWLAYNLPVLITRQTSLALVHRHSIVLAIFAPPLVPVLAALENAFKPDNSCIATISTQSSPSFLTGSQYLMHRERT